MATPLKKWGTKVIPRFNVKKKWVWVGGGFLELTSNMKQVLSRLVKMNWHAWKLCQNCSRYWNVYIRSLWNVRDMNACIEHQHFSPFLQLRYTGFTLAFTNPVYLGCCVYTTCKRSSCCYVALNSSSEKLTVIQKWDPSSNRLAPKRVLFVIV